MKKEPPPSVSIILPCAGHGTRLNLPYPKELVKINENMSIIDYSFQHILASKIKPRVIVIIGLHKFDTVRYLYEKYNDKMELVFVFQKTNCKGITGAIRSAEHLFGDKNILFMPDTIIEYSDKKMSLIDKIVRALDRGPFVFTYKEETSATRLKLFGALRVEDGKVIDYEDKPVARIEKYNAFWASFAFRKEVADEVISVIERSTFKKQNFKKAFRHSILYKSQPIKIHEYVDIGTWTNLNAHLLKDYLISSGIDPELLKIKK